MEVAVHCDSKGQINRRQLLAGATVLAVSSTCADVLADDTLKDIADLRPGQFTWNPDRQPSGPVAIVVSLPQQRVHVYRNGIRIAVSTCSTGRRHSTPTGVFVVLEKDKNHHSSTYNDAPMPNMNRLTCRALRSTPAISLVIRLRTAVSGCRSRFLQSSSPLLILERRSSSPALTPIPGS
jgi:L,D-transpeptidase catalytic domain